MYHIGFTALRLWSLWDPTGRQLFVSKKRWRRGTDEAVNDLVDEFLVPVPLPDFFPDTSGGYVVERFSRFCFSEKKLRKRVSITRCDHTCVVRLPPTVAHNKKGLGSIPKWEGNLHVLPMIVWVFSWGDAGAPDFLCMLRFPLQSKTSILGLISSRCPQHNAPRP